MKIQQKSIVLVLSIVLIALMIPINSSATDDEKITSSHRHSIIYDFDENEMVVSNVYEGSTIENLISDVNRWEVEQARVFSADGEELFEGELEAGMLVKIYHYDKLYGEYTIPRLLKPFLQMDVENGLGIGLNSTTSTSTSKGNAYGFILPIDNIDVNHAQMVGNISQFYGDSHKAIDIASGGSISEINRSEVRAVKSGTVSWVQEWDGVSRNVSNDQSYGNCIKIDHLDGMQTLYAHLDSVPTLQEGDAVYQGQVIGYVGNTGNSGGPHLHFEVIVIGEQLDPLIYLAGAPTYVPGGDDIEGLVPVTYTGDVNGDGYEDIIEIRENNGKRQLVTILGTYTGNVSGSVVIKNTSNDYVEDPTFIGDVNGDGRTDVIVHFVSSGKRSFLIYTGTSTGSFNDAVRIITTNTHNITQYPCKLFVSDFNGDGKDDFLVHYRDLTDGTRWNLLYAGNASGGFDAGVKTVSSRNYFDSDPVYIADVNGDGCSDVVVHWVSEGKRQLLIYKGNTGGSFSSPVNYSTTNLHNSNFETKMFIGDFNGDGKDDFLVHWCSVSGGTRKLLLYRGNSSCGFDAGVQTTTVSDNVSENPVLIGDFNGDGIGDVVVERNSGNYRALDVFAGNSDGLFSDMVTTVTTNTRNPQLYPSRLKIADINNDGRADVVVIWRNTNGSENVIVYKGLVTKLFDVGVKTWINEPYYFGE